MRELKEPDGFSLSSPPGYGSLVQGPLWPSRSSTSISFVHVFARTFGDLGDLRS
jgi:hypothetical protein